MYMSFFRSSVIVGELARVPDRVVVVEVVADRVVQVVDGDDPKLARGLPNSSLSLSIIATIEGSLSGEPTSDENLRSSKSR